MSEEKQESGELTDDDRKHAIMTGKWLLEAIDLHVDDEEE